VRPPRPYPKRWPLRWSRKSTGWRTCSTSPPRRLGMELWRSRWRSNWVPTWMQRRSWFRTVSPLPNPDCQSPYGRLAWRPGKTHRTWWWWSICCRRISP